MKWPFPLPHLPTHSSTRAQDGYRLYTPLRTEQQKWWCFQLNQKAKVLKKIPGDLQFICDWASFVHLLVKAFSAFSPSFALSSYYFHMWKWRADVLSQQWLHMCGHSHFYLSVCLCVCVQVNAKCLGVFSEARGNQSHWNWGYMWWWTTQHECWEWNQGPVQQQSTLHRISLCSSGCLGLMM